MKRCKFKNMSIFNENQIVPTSRKNVGIFEHSHYMVSNINKSIGTLRKLSTFLPRKLLGTIYKSFIRLF